MYTPEAKRYEYWNHFIARAFIQRELSPGITGSRLCRIMPDIMSDDDFWQDVIIRHGGLHSPPERLAVIRPVDYAHCLGNFWGMVMQNLVEAGLVK